MLSKSKDTQNNWRFSIIAVMAGTLVWSCPASAAFTFTKIVDTNTAIPRGTGNFSFNNSDTPAVSGGHIVFDTGDETIWTARTDGSHLRRVLTPGTVIPPGNLGTFQQYYGDYVQIHGTTVVIVGDNCGGCGSGVGIYTKNLASTTINRLVDINTNLPGSSSKFSGFPPDFDESNTTVVFQNRQNLWAVPLVGGPVSRVATNEDVSYSPPSPFCCIFGQPSTRGSRVLMLGGNVFGLASIQRVDVSGDPLSFQFIATGDMHPPGTPGGYRFDNFDFARPVNDRGLIFYGDSNNPKISGSPYIRGIYIRGRGFAKLVDSNTPVPGGTGNFQFGWYGTLSPIAAGKGTVIFGNIDEAGNPALFAVSESGGPIIRIIGRGDPIGGFTVQDLGFRRAGFDGTTLTFSVSYASFLGSGIYATAVVLP